MTINVCTSFSSQASISSISSSFTPYKFKHDKIEVVFKWNKNIFKFKDESKQIARMNAQADHFTKERNIKKGDEGTDREKNYLKDIISKQTALKTIKAATTERQIRTLKIYKRLKQTRNIYIDIFKEKLSLWQLRYLLLPLLSYRSQTCVQLIGIAVLITNAVSEKPYNSQQQVSYRAMRHNPSQNIDTEKKNTFDQQEAVWEQQKANNFKMNT